MKNVSLVSVIFIAIMFFFGCSYHKKIQNEDVIIGAVLPLTGDLAKLGESGKNGLLLAQEYINSKENKKIKIILEDGQGKPVTSINALNKLIATNDSISIFSIVSPVDLSILPIQKKSKFLFISHSTHPKLSGVNDLVFRHSTTAMQESVYIANYLKEESGVAVVYSNDDYGIAFSQQISILRPEWKQISFNKEETNFSTLTNKINAFNKNKIVLCSAGKNTASIIRKLREKNNNCEIITTLGYKSSGADLLNIGDKNITMIDFKKIKIDHEFAKYSDKFVKEKGRPLNPAEIIFFNSGLLLYKSVVAANSSSPISIAHKIKNIQFELLGGKSKVTNQNDIVTEIELVKHN